MAHKVNITLSITKELHDQMKEHPDMKWSEAAREGIKNKLARIGGIIDGRELIKQLPDDARKSFERISKIPVEDWKKHCKQIKEKDKKRLKSLTQTS